MIPYGRQDVTDADIEMIVEVLRSDNLTQGKMIPSFEKHIAEYCKVEFCIAVNSATSALHIACMAIGLGPGDWVWTTPNTFVASANCALYCGADVDFVDIDPCTHNMSMDALSAKLELASSLGKLPSVVIPVHYSGLPAEMDRLQVLARNYGFRIIEDASHAIGAEYEYICEATGERKHTRVGACAHSDITVFSFHPVKVITTGEGGVATTNNPEFSFRMNHLRTHGIVRDEADQQFSAWRYNQVALGYNYRLTDIQAALGISQLLRLETYLLRRRYLFKRYEELLAEVRIAIPCDDSRRKSSHHLYPVQFPSDISRDEIFNQMRRSGIGVNVHYIPVYFHPYYKKRYNLPKGYCKVAEAFFYSTMSLPLYPTMTEEQQDFVITSLRSFV
jgi:UDP-4-amino-4,6-dideoxy-N-acetyl-beta-L-altrosamine transaminase